MTPLMLNDPRLWTHGALQRKFVVKTSPTGTVSQSYPYQIRPSEAGGARCVYRRGGELLEVTTSQPRGGRGRVAGMVPADSVKRDKASYIIMFGDFVSASFYKQLLPLV